MGSNIVVKLDFSIDSISYNLFSTSHEELFNGCTATRLILQRLGYGGIVTTEIQVWTLTATTSSPFSL